MVVATSVVSIGLVILSSKCLRRVAPTTFIPLMFAASALLLLLEWALVSVAPRVAAAVVYLQISGVRASGRDSGSSPASGSIRVLPSAASDRSPALARPVACWAASRPNEWPRFLGSQRLSPCSRA
jgi:hypothetical protein